MQQQSKASSAVEERLEIQLYEQTKEIERLQKEIQQLTRSKREMSEKAVAEVSSIQMEWVLRTNDILVDYVWKWAFEVATAWKRSALWDSRVERIPRWIQNL